VTLPIAILAGGLGTRLDGLTGGRPKPIIDINGEPFLARQLRLLSARGLQRAVVCVGYRGAMIEAAIGDGRRYGMTVEFSQDGEKPLGTAGAVRRALHLLGEAFFVTYGDSYLDIDYSAVHHAFERSHRSALMVVYRNENRWDASNVRLADGAITAYDKVRRSPDMAHIDYGLGVFRRTVFDSLPPGEPADLAAVYQRLLEDGELAGFEATQRFYEIGSPRGLAELRELLAGRPTNVTFTEAYLAETKAIAEQLPIERIEALASLLARTRSAGGRVFVLGVGGSAANASHLTSDLRRIADLEAYAPTDNVAEFSARVNDEGWAGTFAGWLKVSRLRPGDLVFVLSVGGGDRDLNVSPNLVAAIDYAREVGASVAGIVGRGDGYTARTADVAVVVPTVNTRTVTPHSEAFQVVIWHLLVSHPLLKRAETKWESLKP